MKAVPDAGKPSPGGPPADADEALELTEDAIVAAQTAAHALKPRARVAIEARSIVVADAASVSDAPPVAASPDGGRGKPRELGAYTRTVEKTVVAQRKAGSTAPVLVAPRRKGTGSRALVIWGAAGAVAFALGGVLSLASGGKPAPEPAEPAPPSPAPQAAAVEPAAAEPAPPPSAEAAVAGTAAAPLPKVNAAQLPVEKPIAAPRGAPRPRTAEKPKPGPARPPSDIPEGI
ncbi:MAG: hypothetical protein IT376_06445 [Polyangiaceae bacterium]|nr:hypothetical protein [Polyangiaceae bacterium]